MTSLALTSGPGFARSARLAMLLWLGLTLGCTGPLTNEQVSVDPPLDVSANLPPDRIQALVRERCAERGSADPDFLALLVAELYAADVQADAVTEALLRADCASLAAVIRAVVAQGGPEVVGPVVERARTLTGPTYEPVIAAGVLLGLDQNGADRRAGEREGPYGMVYFPTRGSGAPLATAPAAASLYQAATPGYGVYTFVVYGADLAALSAEDRSRYRELLRVIETYVLDPNGASDDADTVAHAFVIPVEPETSGTHLQAPENASRIEALARDMRAALLAHVRARESVARAERLADRPGPFLVSGVEPRLTPTEGDGPRLVVDLSEVGAGYFYAIVDAYDRSAGPEPARDRLESIVGRLQRLFRSHHRSPQTVTSGEWIFWLQPVGADREATLRVQSVPAQAAAGLAARASSRPYRFEFKG